MIRMSCQKAIDLNLICENFRQASKPKERFGTNRLNSDMHPFWGERRCVWPRQSTKFHSSSSRSHTHPRTDDSLYLLEEAMQLVKTNNCWLIVQREERTANGKLDQKWINWLSWTELVKQDDSLSWPTVLNADQNLGFYCKDQSACG